ncbi:hypothetical protein O0L34_g18924 [Tuta absoluta]|nr:hypothetical protein O0L34_g18924 [Tuta absoluta]
MENSEAKEEHRKSIDMDLLREEIREKAKKKHLIYTPDLLLRIKDVPALWDKNNPEYRSINRSGLWAKICAEMIPDFHHMAKSARRDFVSRLIKKWHNTRDSYRKSVRAKKPYVYSQFLTFLDPIMADVSLLGAKNDEDESYYPEMKYEEDDDEDGCEEHTVDFNEESRDRKRTKEVFIGDTEVTPAKLLKEAISNDWDGPNTSYGQNENLLSIIKTMLEKESDEDRAFFNSLIPSVKRLSQGDKLEFRLQILTSLKNLTAKERDPIDFEYNST